MRRARRATAGRALSAGAAIALVGACALGLGCFTERSTATGLPGGACDVALPPELLGATVVAIRDFTFQPSEVRVPVGGTVAWVNCAPADEPAHTSTSDAGVWNSSLLSRGSTFGFTFSQAGTFSYHCEPHPFMQAAVIVGP